MSDLSTLRMVPIPDHILSILHETQRVAPGAVLAGGYLRDLFHEVPHNDVDIFFPTTSETHEASLNAIAGVFGEPTDLTWSPGLKAASKAELEGGLETIPIDVSYREWENTIIGVHEILVLGERVQFIGVDFSPEPFTATRVLERMDMGLCQIAYDGTRLHMTAAFWRDSENRTFTVLPHVGDRYPKSIKRWRKFANRYPEHNLVLTRPQTEEP